MYNCTLGRDDTDSDSVRQCKSHTYTFSTVTPSALPLGSSPCLLEKLECTAFDLPSSFHLQVFTACTPTGSRDVDSVLTMILPEEEACCCVFYYIVPSLYLSDEVGPTCSRQTVHTSSISM